MVTDYPKAIAPVDHIEPVPRRIRAVLGGETILDTLQQPWWYRASAGPLAPPPPSGCDRKQRLAGRD
jgi:hypothetical protein